MSFHEKYRISDKNQPDYSLSDRPATRNKLLFSMLWEHKAGIFLFSLAYTVVFLPSCIWVFLNGLLLKSILVNGGGLSAQSVFSFLLILFPTITLSGPGAAGLYRIARNWMRNEPLHPCRVFLAAVKDSWKGGLLLAFLRGLLPLLSFFAYIAFGRYTASPLLLAALLVFLLAALLWLLMLPGLEVMTVTYTLSFPQMLWNGLYFTLRHPLKSLKTRLLAALPELAVSLFCLSAPGALPQLLAVLAAYYMFYGFGLRQMLFAAHGNFLCEQYLNPHIPGARLNIGMCSETRAPSSESEPPDAP